jgi:hypothetical protein
MRVHRFLYMEDPPSSQSQVASNGRSTSPYHWTEQDLEAHCRKLMPTESSKQAPYLGPTGNVFGWPTTNPDDGSLPEKFPYNENRANISTKLVFNAFIGGYQKFDSEQKERLADIEKRTSRFGYLLQPYHFYDGAALRSNTLLAWDLFHDESKREQTANETQLSMAVVTEEQQARKNKR